MTLLDLEAGERATVKEIPGEDLQYQLSFSDIYPGSEVEVVGKFPGMGVLLLKANEELATLQQDKAKSIEIEKLS
ncbi:MAG: ferrous iron transport protein A [Firmicutes bacterium]|nr:ferrous iron transport protein A [Bacillota bacterium]